MPLYITDWLNTNVDPVGSAVIVDSSLTVDGAAADAKITGNEFINTRKILQQDEYDIALKTEWQQGAWISIASWEAGHINTASSRIAFTYTLEEPITFIRLLAKKGYRYGYALFSSDKIIVRSSTWTTEDRELNPNIPFQYIRIEVSKEDNSTIKPSEAPFAISVLLKPSYDKQFMEQEQINNNTNEILSSSLSYVYNDAYESGYWSHIELPASRTIISSSRRIAGSFISNFNTKYCYIDFDKDRYDCSICFENENHIVLLAKTNWKVSEPVLFQLDDIIKYIYIEVRHPDNSVISLEEGKNIYFRFYPYNLLDVNNILLLSEEEEASKNNRTLTKNDFIQGTLDSNGQYKSSQYKLVTEHYIPTYNMSLYLEIDSSDYLMYIDKFDENFNYLGHLYGGYQSSFSYNFKDENYIKITIKYADASNTNIITPDIFGLTTISIKDTNSQFTSPDLKLCCMQHNLGKFHYGLTPPGYPGEDKEEQLQNWKNMYIKYKPDILFAQEYNDNFDVNSEISAGEELYDPILPYGIFNSHFAIRSKFKLYNKTIVSAVGTKDDGSTYTSSLLLCQCKINNQIIYLLSLHLSPGYGDEYDRLRTSQAEDLIPKLEQYYPIIIGGDTNSNIESFFDLWKQAGYKMANHEYFGVIETLQNGSKTRPEYVDNIMTRGFLFYDAESHAEDACTSDHYPLVSNIRLDK